MNITYRIKFFLFVTLRVWKYKFLSDCHNISGSPKVYSPLLITGKGKVSFGKNTQIGVITSPYFYSHYNYIEARDSHSEISLGSNVSINNAFSATAFSKITIKDNVLIGVNCAIIDNDGHNIAPDKRHENAVNTAEVFISENVFLGDNVTILKGVTIGRNSVIGNGSIVTRSIPDNVVAAGSPARVIRSL